MIDSEKQHAFARMIRNGMVLATAKTEGVVSTSEEEAGWIEVAKEPTKYGAVNETAGAWIPSWADEWIAEFMPVYALEKAQGFGGNRSEAGRYAAQQRWKGHMKSQPAKATAPVKADVVTNDPDEALDALRQGKTVSLGSVDQVNTLIKEMNDFVQEAKKKGEKVKLNLCQVSVPGTNLFCGSSLKDDQGKPIPRDKMPQLAGKPKPGSPAADAKKFPVDKDGEVNVGDAFVKYLAEKGVETREGSVPAAQLKASQSELKGKTVAFMMSKEGQKTVDLENQSIFVSSDGYVIDGHHRWAAMVGKDSKDGKLGDNKIKVRVINMPIKQVLADANAFTSAMGIEPKSA
jgi:hypothetical protein